MKDWWDSPQWLAAVDLYDAAHDVDWEDAQQADPALDQDELDQLYGNPRTPPVVAADKHDGPGKAMRQKRRAGGLCPNYTAIDGIDFAHSTLKYFR